MKNKVELLAPSGNFDCVRAAISNGANAVYLGGRLFNARAFAANFDNEELKEVCDFCHLYDAKVYVTVNTLYKNEEFPELISFIDELYAMGVDGLIMQDIGAIALVRKYWPDLPVHVSTQLTSKSLEDIKWYEREGVRTVVLSRELSIEEIRNIKANTSMRIETFIHGALCVSYSGQCLMSSVLGARSGNRGKCAQNCRMNYALVNKGREVAQGHLLSTKDICTLDVLPDILEAGVDSLKIEGRMKSP
ncbi:MAG: U32 family peptidase, partial [Erysipelotrichaceae bacterium]|nr:U32 family peptidase [Erysipelotrichaceae bacterium]